MDTTSYEEHRLGKEDVWANYITEGSPVQLMAWNDKIISVDLPNVVPLKVWLSKLGWLCVAAQLQCMELQLQHLPAEDAFGRTMPQLQALRTSRCADQQDRQR